MDKLTLLTNLVISEVSAVDEGANLLPGWMVAKRRDRKLAEDRTAFSRLIEDIRTAPDLTDDEKVAKVRKAIEICPQEISVPVLKEKVLADRIRETYGLTEKARHDLRDGIGRFAAAPEDPPAHEVEQTIDPIFPWRHSGAAIPSVHGH